MEHTQDHEDVQVANTAADENEVSLSQLPHLLLKSSFLLCVLGTKG